MHKPFIKLRILVASCFTLALLMYTLSLTEAIILSINCVNDYTHLKMISLCAYWAITAVMWGTAATSAQLHKEIAKETPDASEEQQ